jgi:hypothetical protein
MNPCQHKTKNKCKVKTELSTAVINSEMKNSIIHHPENDCEKSRVMTENIKFHQLLEMEAVMCLLLHHFFIHNLQTCNNFILMKLIYIK